MTGATTAALLAAVVLAPQAVGAQAATLPDNGFERPAAGGAYPLSEWIADGWNAPWALGMEDRVVVDAEAPAYEGDKSLRVLYPEGKIGPENSGASAPFTLPKAPEYYLSYAVRFDENFSWGTSEYAGKVGLGLAGGKSCSGGQVCDGTNGFSSRPIWRQNNGQAAIYYYSMGHEGEYGDYTVLKRDGADIHWPRGEWVTITQRLKVNTVTNGAANPDGEIEIFFNGVSAALVTDLRFVTNADQVDRAYLSSFAGGAEETFAPAHDSYIWYDDLRVSTTRPADL
ncbi:polysaccharide lyase [Pseudonocardia sp. HH130630-07]|uniref:polysaccharide lyase n=1 Tax=Pseudonocardia sp. HH130630-07 TaxID=1690815 RepID=UPI0018D27E1D|nr:hypothetical protein [Pseudonocardia sp. HH130630-07]